MVLSRIFQSLNPKRDWFKRVSPSTVKADLTAGLTNAAIVLPQGVAFAIIAGMPPEYGLFTAMVVTFVAALWGSSMTMVSGPTTAISAVLFASLAPLAAPSSETYILLAAALTLMAGLIQMLAGVFRLGGFISFISHSVLVGFTAAAALLIASSQLGGALGIKTEGGGGVFERLWRVIEHAHQFNGSALIIAGSTLLSLIVLNRISKKIPAYVIALAVGSVVSFLMGAPDKGVAVFAPLESIAPSFSAPEFSVRTFHDILPAAITIAFVGLLEAISIGRSFAVRREEEYDTNQEMIGQGLSNVVGSFFQCYAGSGSFTRSGLNADSGAKTPLAAISASGFLCILLWILAPYLQYVPVPAMSAIILFVAFRLINFSEVTHILKAGKNEIIILGATFATGVLTELDLAIVVGVITSLGVFLYESAHPVIHVGAPSDVNGRRVFRNAARYGLAQCPQITVARIEGPLFFASIEYAQAQFRDIHVAANGPSTMLLGLKGLWKIDLSGADLLIKEMRHLRKSGGDFHVFTTNTPALKMFERLHVFEILGAKNLHNNKAEAIAAAVENADVAICKTCQLRVFIECAGKPRPTET